MRLVLDACVLFPTLMRAVLMVGAKAGGFEPVWSDRILEEWRRAVQSKFPDQSVMVQSEIAVLNANWPNAARKGMQDTASLWLPDENDIHVLGLAIASSADGIVTVNRKDFPQNILSEYALKRFDPDTFLLDVSLQNEARFFEEMAPLAAKLQIDFPERSLRRVMRKARLPRLGKRLETIF